MHQDRKGDYPQFENVIYLDSAGTPPYSQELIERVHEDLRHRRHANPHSNSGPAQAIANDIQSVRKQVLKFFGASTEDWDVVFVANATAAIKLTADCFRDYAEANGKEFWYGYHRDSHTSLVGARELAKAHRCFIQDGDIDEWIVKHTRAGHQSKRVNLLAYPGQSNMTGRRLPHHWPGLIRGNTDNESETYTLLDAAALASTSPLDLSKTSTSPDLVAVSFYKIFGYPQLGALIVQRQSAKLRKLLLSRRYFGGGTVDMVTTIGGSWHVKKNGSLHEALEDGTPLTNSIIATKIAIECHHDKYGEKPMVEVAKYTTCLARGLVEALSALRHANGKPIIRLYSDFSTGQAQGPVIAFNVLRADGSLFPYNEVERLANERNICLRTGSFCNPGGFAGELGWTPEELQQAYAAGHRCSKPESVVFGKATGVIRVSLGMHNTAWDVRRFILFVRDTLIPKLLHEIPQRVRKQKLWYESLISVS